MDSGHLAQPALPLRCNEWDVRIIALVYMQMSGEYSQVRDGGDSVKAWVVDIRIPLPHNLTVCFISGFRW